MTRLKSAGFILYAAVSLDGRITAGEREGTEWTGKEDKRFFQRELDRADAVVMGRRTFAAIKRPLAPRNRIVFSRSRTFSHSADCQSVFCGTAAQLLRLLAKKNWKRVAVAGGTEIYDWFLTRNIIDEIYLTVEPVIFGSGKLLTSKKLEQFSRFSLLSVKRLSRSGTLLLHYKK